MFHEHIQTYPLCMDILESRPGVPNLAPGDRLSCKDQLQL